jgi:hypothetical protein
VFEQVHAALASGDAVGIFPEGLSHSEPSLTTLRTGAARIALGAATHVSTVVPIVPIGIVLPTKDRFRSRALVMIGPPVEWSDLATRTEDDAVAVRELTDRIEDGLRDLTINLERIEDGPVIRCAEAVYAVELGLDRAPAEKLRRLRQATEMLRGLRRDQPKLADELFLQVGEFEKALALLDLSPAGLEATVRPRAAVGWSVWNLGYFLVGVPIAAIGHLLFLPPYQLTDYLTRDPALRPDIRSARKLLGGGALYLLWCLLLAAGAGLWFGAPAAIAAAVTLPLLALLTLAVRERWRDARRELRQYFVLRATGDIRRRLITTRGELARSLESVRQRFAEDGE